MSTAVFWIVQALGLISVVFTSLSFIQKEKWKIMIFLSATNLLYIVIYLLSGSLTGCLLCAGALARTIVYFIYSKLNKKPEIIIMIMFEIYTVVMAIVAWQGIVDLLMIVNLIVLTYTTWQNDIRLLRYSYVFSTLLLVPYDILLGAYTTVLSEVIMFGFVIYAIIKYSKSTKNAFQIAERYHAANRHFWGSVVQNFENFQLITSSTDSSPYYNYCMLKNYNNTYDSILEIKKVCKQNNLKELVYIPFETRKVNESTSQANTLQLFFPTEFNDVWMKLADGLNLNSTKCKIKDVTFKSISESEIEDAVEVYLMGYCNKTSKKALTENEKLQVENLRNANLTDFIDGYKTTIYIAYFHNKPVALVGTLSNKIETFVTKVSTIPRFRRNHIASGLIQFAIGDQRNNGVQDVMLVTDKNSIPEKFYAYNNFYEVGQAYALNVSDMKDYKKFVEKGKI